MPSTFNEILSVFLAFAGAVGVAYGFLRFLVKPMINEEIERSKSWYVKFDEREHERLIKEIEKERSDRTQQVDGINQNLQYIRTRVDQIAERLPAAG